MKRLAGLLLRWPVAVAIALDMLVSAIFFGAPWELISARLGRSLPYCSLCHRFCALLSRLLGRDHCQESWQIYENIKKIVGD
ncbi:MAG: hypothetical protein KGL26_03110 [Pseudomonadota bacterium]|nr:hypothetical protein [Pseudomonadota bacterium]